MGIAPNESGVTDNMPDGPCDPRAIANLILDFADSCSLPVSHLALQKLLYFAHARYLVQRGQPLVNGPFEAWQRGPVHPAIYQSFKAAKDRPIRFRAKARNVLTGEERAVTMPDQPDVRRHVMHGVATYGGLSPSHLVALSHTPGGPWDHVVSTTKRRRGGVALGERIVDDVIRAFFARPSVGFKAGRLIPDNDEPCDETEPTSPD